MKSKIKQIWSWLDGNKTIITGAIFTLFQLSLVKERIDPQALEIIQWGTGTLWALSGADHAYKGFFSPKVGGPGQPIPEKKPLWMVLKDIVTKK